MRRYYIPSEVSSEIKLNKFIYLTDLLVLLGLFILRSMTVNYVHSKFQLVFTIFLIIVGIIAIMRPHSNPQKRMFEAMLYAIARRKDTYTAIDYEEKENSKW